MVMHVMRVVLNMASPRLNVEVIWLSRASCQNHQTEGRYKEEGEKKEASDKAAKAGALRELTWANPNQSRGPNLPTVISRHQNRGPIHTV